MALDVVIGNISPGSVKTPFLTSCLAARDAGVQFVLIQSSGYLDDGRNEVVKKFLEATEKEWLLFIDSDIEFTVADIERLVASADRKERPVVAGTYFSQVGDEGAVVPLIYFWSEGPRRKMEVVDGHFLAGKVGLVECDGTGAGFLLVHRDFLVEMAGEYASRESLPWFDEPLRNGVHFGEDLAFFIRVAELGHKLYVNVDVRVAHHKSMRLIG
jgi:hypothetical protein